MDEQCRFFAGLTDRDFLDRAYEREIVIGDFATVGRDFENLLRNTHAFLLDLDNRISDDLFVFRSGIACRRSVLYAEAKCEILWDNVWKMHNQERGTVYLRGLQKHSTRVEAILERIADAFPKKKLFANLFISPPSAVGLKAHFDPTDFFILQISGRKEWHFWPAPERGQAEAMMPEEVGRYCGEIQTTQPPYREVILEAGQVMYVPLHMIHAPITRDDPSTHVTLGLAAPELRNRIKD